MIINCHWYSFADTNSMKYAHFNLCVLDYYARTHYQNGLHVIVPPEKRKCPAQITVYIPVDETDSRAVVIPAAGVPHFPRSKVPAAVQHKYYKCIDAAGVVGTTTLRVDKSSSTLNILGGKLPQEYHPSLINNPNRRDMVKNRRGDSFPEGTGLQAIYSEFEKDRSQAIGDRYIHAVTTRADGMHIIITINPDLAALALAAIWKHRPVVDSSPLSERLSRPIPTVTDRQRCSLLRRKKESKKCQMEGAVKSLSNAPGHKKFRQEMSLQ
ncbi:hypothetical protein B0H11DRAFT_1911893 [Mycena galericulata]|nr:hypothetical protein B0H11DRAFT_1911893 [Mycena galericulata]